jgi:hypothetical protein
VRSAIVPEGAHRFGLGSCKWVMFVLLLLIVPVLLFDQCRYGDC